MLSSSLSGILRMKIHTQEKRGKKQEGSPLSDPSIFDYRNKGLAQGMKFIQFLIGNIGYGSSQLFKVKI